MMIMGQQQENIFIIDTKQQQQQQDGKRTLIKNQLYLIEQLQLENANLRNERDQLQLENEELKFQLQMISSSNILNQPGSAFNGQRQLERLVESDETAKLATTQQQQHSRNSTIGTTIRTTHSVSINASPQMRPDCVAGIMPAHSSFSNSNNCDKESDPATTDGCGNLSTRLPTAAHTTDREPLGRPAQAIEMIDNDAHNGFTSAIHNNINSNDRDHNHHYGGGGGNQSTVRPQQTGSFKLDSVVSGGLVQLSNDDYRHQQRRDKIDSCLQSLVTTTTTTTSLAAAATIAAAGNHGEKSTHSNMTTMVSISQQNLITEQANNYTHHQHLSNALHRQAREYGGNTNVDDDDDDDQFGAKLVERLYGDDSERVQAAVVTIQRAFRKYQICKRFRTITEQLRHTCQSSSTTTTTMGQQSLERTTTTTVSGSGSGLELQRHKRETNDSPTARKQTTSNNGGDGGNQSSIPFVTGTTKAAAWESLSYAASKLAASAAAATATTKQVLVNGVTKSASSQHVSGNSHPTTANIVAPQAATATATAQQLSSMQTRTAASERINNNNNSNATTASFNEEQQRPMKSSNPVVAAAINFQQLESIRKRQYRVGLNIFNKSPEKGVSFLIAHSFIDASSTQHSKSSPGYYLSNQMHFIDKQQHLANQQNQHNQQRQQQQLKHLQQEKFFSALNFSSCQFCFEEENLKRNVAHFLLHRKGLAKEKIGQYLGNLQCQFNQDVLKYYLQELDFYGLQIDIALRKFLATLRLPGEAQKIERFVDCFAQRYVQCQQQQAVTQQQTTPTIHLTSRTVQTKQDQQQQPTTTNQYNNNNNYTNNLTLLSRDEIFILTFAIIMLNTDLHSPSLKPTSRMSPSQFIHNLRGVFKSQTIMESDLNEIYERVKANQITTTPDHVSHVMKVQQGLTVTNFQRKELPNLCVPHRRLVCFCRLFEVYDVNKKERIGQHQREIFLFNDMLLVTKLARRARANTPQQYAYRQSIALQGLYVQLFQSAHYNYGIRLCRRSNEETLIMFNARNELDQSRFVDDLTESIAEMDEMESIRQHNVIETIHSRCQERLRRHASMHDNSYENFDQTTTTSDTSENETSPSKNHHIIIDNQFNQRINGSPTTIKIEQAMHRNLDADGNPDLLDLSECSSSAINSSPSATAVLADGSDSSSSKLRLKAKFHSMSNLASVEEAKCDSFNDSHVSGLRQNRSFVQRLQQQQHQQPNNNQLAVGQQRQHRQPRSNVDANNSSGTTQQSCSSASVHSLDSGFFISRDVSPNQSS